MFQARHEIEGDVYDPVVPLTEMTRKAIDTLSRNPEGFFLVVEEEAIDGMSHQNNAKLMLEAGRQLDEAVGVAKAYAEDNPDTLLIVTADHETGGLAVEGTNEDDASLDADGPFAVNGSDQEFSINWTTRGHSAVDVPVTAMGPGAADLTGVYENTHIHDVMKGSLFNEHGGDEGSAPNTSSHRQSDR